MPKTLRNGLVVYSCADWGARTPHNAPFTATTPTDIVLH